MGRESSIQLIQSLGDEKTIVVVAQRDARMDSPQPSDLHAYGTLATVHKVVKMPNQSLFVFTEGTERVKLGMFSQIEPFMTAVGRAGPGGPAPKGPRDRSSAAQRPVRVPADRHLLADACPTSCRPSL